MPLQVCKRRLQVHREVLKQIIANFHAYRPLLSAIMNAYDNMIGTQQDLLAELRPVQNHYPTGIYPTLETTLIRCHDLPPTWGSRHQRQDSSRVDSDRQLPLPRVG